MRKSIGLIITSIIVVVLLFLAPAHVAAVNNDYPKISFESERDIIYLPIGDSIELRINNPMVLPTSWMISTKCILITIFRKRTYM